MGTDGGLFGNKTYFSKTKNIKCGKDKSILRYNPNLKHCFIESSWFALELHQLCNR